ncbi:helix-hairpin-helix domain-containing protein [Arthrobacter sp. AB6]|uniref:ComEA family DNA-binding protein n=1 Tax=Arthrobacter sp. AB6 TaxID=2962570 RepID=UPI002881479B|nr:helix-hairpin-helix domain-containing protein [Arthrobacter sp. AB6]MDT0195930.1 helix-hairpin-helix domain-containing protein [Arthrobacter sp. AB6]
MSRRDAGEAGGSARHASKRLRAALGQPPAGLLLNGHGPEPFEYRGPAGDPPGASPHSPPAGSRQDVDPAATTAVGPALRWRLGPRLALLLGILSVAAGAWFWWQTGSGRPETLPLSGISPGSPVAEGAPAGDRESGGGPEAATDATGDESSGSVVVHVAGAVARPGVVQLPAGSRVHEAVAAAGGGAPGADLNRLNLALAVEDGQKIHVPREGEAVPAAGRDGAGQDGGSSATAAEGKINLNTAGVEELDALPKVGPVLARRIVDWRKEHGAFKSVEELDAVDGVGPKMLEALLPLVTV